MNRPDLLPWARRLLWLYPRAWRLRYQEEMLALFSEYPLTLWTLADILVGAADAHLHRHLLPMEVLTMAQQIRTSANALFVAFTLFFVAWLMIPFISDSHQLWIDATARHVEIGWVMDLFQLAGVVALLALLVGGLPILLAVVQQAVKERRRDLLSRLATPMLLAGVVVAFSFVAQPTWWHRLGLTLPNAGGSPVWLKVSFFALVFLCLGLSTWVLTETVTRSQLSDRVLRFTRIPGILIGLALWVSFVAVLLLTILVFADAPQLAQPAFLLPSFDALLLCSCWIASAALSRMVAATAAARRSER